MRISKGAAARANRQQPLDGVRHELPAEANRAGLRSVDRIFSGRWPGHVGDAVRATVRKRLEDDAKWRDSVVAEHVKEVA
jgi:hypothetical protein